MSVRLVPPCLGRDGTPRAIARAIEPSPIFPAGPPSAKVANDCLPVRLFLSQCEVSLPNASGGEDGGRQHEKWDYFGVYIPSLLHARKSWIYERCGRYVVSRTRIAAGLYNWVTGRLVVVGHEPHQFPGRPPLAKLSSPVSDGL